MNIESFRTYCLSLPHVTEKMPFDDKILVFYIGGKMFTLCDLTHFDFINVKCDPEKALELRAEYEEVRPGYHMSKKHWNSIYVNGRLSDSQIKQWVKDSYDLVFQGLPKKLQKELTESIK